MNNTNATVVVVFDDVWVPDIPTLTDNIIEATVTGYILLLALLFTALVTSRQLSAAKLDERVKVAYRLVVEFLALIEFAAFFVKDVISVIRDTGGALTNTQHFLLRLSLILIGVQEMANVWIARKIDASQLEVSADVALLMRRDDVNHGWMPYCSIQASRVASWSGKWHMTILLALWVGQLGSQLAAVVAMSLYSYAEMTVVYRLFIVLIATWSFLALWTQGAFIWRSLDKARDPESSFGKILLGIYSLQFVIFGKLAYAEYTHAVKEIRDSQHGATDVYDDMASRIGMFWGMAYFATWFVIFAVLEQHPPEVTVAEQPPAAATTPRAVVVKKRKQSSRRPKHPDDGEQSVQLLPMPVSLPPPPPPPVPQVISVERKVPDPPPRPSSNKPIPFIRAV